MTKDFDKQDGKNREPRKKRDGKAPFSRFQWDSVDDAQQEDLIEPVAKRKTRTVRRRDKDVGTMYVVPHDELFTPVKKAVVQPHAEDFAQFRAEVEDGEEEPYAIPSYGGMKVSHDIEVLAEELVGRQQENHEKKERRVVKRQTAARSQEEQDGERKERAPRTAKRDAKKESEPTPEVQVEVSVEQVKPRKRSFLSKIQEAISTGRIGPAKETQEKVEETKRAQCVDQLPAKKLRSLTQSAKKVLDAVGLPSDNLGSDEGRGQLDVLADLVEALVKANLVFAERTAAQSVATSTQAPSASSSGKKSGSGSKRAVKAENVFDVRSEEEPKEEAVLEEKKGRPERKERPAAKACRESETSEEKPSPAFDDEEMFAFWENIPDDEEPLLTPKVRGADASETTLRDDADDFDDWVDVESKKKSARFREDQETQSVFQAPSAELDGAQPLDVEREPEPESTLETTSKREDDPKKGSKRIAKKSSESKKNESKTLTRFGELSLPKAILKALSLMGYSEPTPIQSGTIPSIQSGVDVMGQAKTGSGKTAAYMIPIVEGVCKCEPASGPLALIVVPTRELAVQVRDESQKIAKFCDLNVIACYGGKPIASQVEKIRRGVDILVGTPGRIIDLNNRGVLDLGYTHWVVLDEADRMLDIGFRPDVEKILRKTPRSRQTLLFSATLAPPVVKLAQTYMREPENFDFSPNEITAETIEQFYMTVDQDRKFDALTKLLETQKPHQAIVFCRTKRHVDMVGRRLSDKFAHVQAIHGDLSQSQRDSIMRDFRAEKTKILVATDIVGRGIDVSTVSHIINYDIPQYCDDYVHRVGRAGRMGREGVAYTLVTAEEGSELTRIEIRIGRLLQRFELPDFEAVSKPVEGVEQPERKHVFGQRARRFSRAL